LLKKAQQTPRTEAQVKAQTIAEDPIRP